MFLRLPVALILALCAATCAREHLNPKLVSKNIHLRTIEPSVSDEFCNCFDGNSGEEAIRCFNDTIRGKKPSPKEIKNCLKKPDESAKCKVAFLLHLMEVYLIDLSVIDSGANVKLGELYQSHPSLEGVCTNWESHGKDYVQKKLNWVFQHAFVQKDLADKSELPDFNAAFSSSGWQLEVDRICNKDPSKEYCKVGLLSEQIFKKASAFVSVTDRSSDASESYERCLSAFQLNFFLIKRNYPNLIEGLSSLSASDEAEIIKRMLEFIVLKIKTIGATDLVKIMMVLPGTDEIKDCDALPYRAWCHFKIAIDQTKQLIILKKGGLMIKKSKKAKKKPKVIHTNLNYKEFLAESQADMIWSFAASQSLDALNFAEDMKKELEQTTGARFSELRQYFVKVQSFNYEKAVADIAFLQGEVDSYNKTAQRLSNEISHRVWWLLAKTLGATALGVFERVIVFAECLNPTGWVTDSDKISDLKDTIEGVGEQLVDTAHAQYLFNSFESLGDLLLKIGTDFYSNTVFLQDTYKMMPESGKAITFEEFEKSKNKFLANYNNYSPQVFEENIAKLETEWENVIEGACGLLEENDAIPVSGLNVMVPTYCWELKALIQELIEVYSEIYDYQFELMDAMAAYIRGMTGYTAAKEISKDFDRIMNAGSSDGDNVRESELVGMVSYITYEVQQQQAILDYCNILTYKNGGNEFLECKKTNINVAELLSLEPAKCTFTYEYVDIPVKVRKASKGKYGPDVSRSKDHDTSFSVDFSSLDLNAALSGRKMTFQVPNKQWLVDNHWIQEDEKDDPIFIAGLSLFLPRTKDGRSHIISEATFSSKNYITVKGTSYILSPGPHFIYEYKEGKGSDLSCARPPIDHPYKHCTTSHPAKICPLSKERPLNNEAATYPSIFSRFFVSVAARGPTFRKRLLNVAPMTIKAGVSLCKFQSKPNADEALRRKRSTVVEYGCCREGRYWFSTRKKCVRCRNGTPMFYQSYCLKERQSAS